MVTQRRLPLWRVSLSVGVDAEGFTTGYVWWIQDVDGKTKAVTDLTKAQREVLQSILLEGAQSIKP